MNTPPMAGGWMKYWKIRDVTAATIVFWTLTVDANAMAAVPARVMRIGTHSAFVWSREPREGGEVGPDVDGVEGLSEGRAHRQATARR